VQLAPPPVSGPPPRDVAAALEAARTRLGHRPAVTVLRPGRRDEQGVASLAQWAAKGAHLLEADLLLGPGDTLLLDAPLSWPTAAVCLAAWWAGVVVTLDVPADVAVVHEDRERPGPGEVLWLGDAIDGAPTRDVPGEPWVRAVQAFPDQPPPAAADPDGPALRAAGRSWTQAQLLADAADLGEGTLGCDADTIDAVTGVVAVALRPLVIGRPTVVLRGVGRDAATGERVTTWR
jgi:uncharacterized protein (TIGR03089 family)